MNTQSDIASIAFLIGEPARATILTALLGGVALPAGELAMRCRLTQQTVSAHLAKLVAGGLLVVESCGRHRYYRLASVDVGHALEAFQVIAPLFALYDSQMKPERCVLRAHAMTIWRENLVSA
jgi:DNA-binding transcriptional ArsR family regulator